MLLHSLVGFRYGQCRLMDFAIDFLAFQRVEAEHALARFTVSASLKCEFGHVGTCCRDGNQ